MRFALALFLLFMIAMCLLGFAIAGWLGFFVMLGVWILWSIVMVVIG